MTLFRRLLVLLLASTAADAEESRPTQLIRQYPHTSWTERDGLPSPPIYAIAQDREGYLWLGSTSGLTRFDGVHFVSSESISGVALPQTTIRCLCFTRDDSLWLGFHSPGGVSRIHNGSLSSYTFQDGLPQGSIRALLEDDEGTLWAGGYGGLARLRSNRWERLDQRHGLTADMTVDGLYQDRSGHLWIVTTAGVFRRSPAQDVFERIETLPGPALAFEEDGARSRWTTTSSGRQEGNVDSCGSSRILALTPEGANGSAPLRDRRQGLWVGTKGDGVLYAPVQSSTGRAFFESLTRRDGLTGDAVEALFEDREGNIWIGTRQGLDRIAASTPKQVSSPPMYGRSPVQAIAVTREGALWLGTANGLRQFSGKVTKWHRRRSGLPGEAISALYVDGSGSLWVATDRGPVRFANGRFAPLALPVGTRVDRVFAMTTDTEGGLWLGDFAGPVRWKQGVIDDFRAVPGVGGRPVASMHTDSRGRVWIGYSNGGLVIHENGRFESHEPATGLSDGSVFVIYEDRAGAVWVGTRQGLTKFENGRQLTLTHKQGLPGNEVRAFAEDDRGYLWLGTASKLIRMTRGEFDHAASDPTYQMQYTPLDAFDGLDSGIAFGSPASIRTDDGTLWFATASGLAVVDPRQVRDTPLPPLARIEQISVDEHTLTPGPHARLPSLTRRLQIDYTSVTLVNPSKVKFRYMLEGFDDKWIEAGTLRRASYTNLPPRKYQFRVAASRDGGAWNESAASWAFSIRPAFYQTSWFYAICALAVALTLWSAWQLRLRAIRNRYGLVIAERARVGREIHDTLLQSLGGVALELEVVASELASSSPSSSAIKSFRDLRRHVAESIREARQSIWELRAETTESPNLPKAFREWGEYIRGGKTVEFDWVVEGRPPGVGSREVDEQLLRIGQEAMSNAVRHGKARQVRVELHYDRHSVLLRVSDDGQGFDPNGVAYGHWGLVSMRERAMGIGGHFRLASTPGSGTMVETVVPLLSTS